MFYKSCKGLTWGQIKEECNDIEAQVPIWTYTVLVECIAMWGKCNKQVVLCCRIWCVCKWSSSKHVCEGPRDGRDQQQVRSSLCQPLVASRSRRCPTRCCSNLLVLFDCVSACHSRHCRTRCCLSLLHRWGEVSLALLALLLSLEFALVCHAWACRECGGFKHMSKMTKYLVNGGFKHYV